jgi:hypothetical protein
VYYKLNSAYAIQPQDRAPVIVVGREMREFLDASVMPLEPLTSKFAVNRAKRALLRDTTALNWLVATKADRHAGTWPGLTKPTIGSDPEIFLHEAGTLIPAFDVLPGKRKQTDVFWDGFQAEMTTTSQSCLQQNVESLQSASTPSSILFVQSARRPSFWLRMP